MKTVSVAKRALGALLAFVVAFGLLPASALAAAAFPSAPSAVNRAYSLRAAADISTRFPIESSVKSEVPAIPKKGDSFTITGIEYEVMAAPTDAGIVRVGVVLNKGNMNVTLPTGTIAQESGFTYIVTAAVIGSEVKRIPKRAFADESYAAVNTLVVRSKLLKKSRVKGCLKGSNIQTVQVAVSDKPKVNKKFKKRYKKIFQKKNSGRKVAVMKSI